MAYTTACSTVQAVITKQYYLVLVEGHSGIVTRMVTVLYVWHCIDGLWYEQPTYYVTRTIASIPLQLNKACV